MDGRAGSGAAVAISKVAASMSLRIAANESGPAATRDRTPRSELASVGHHADVGNLLEASEGRLVMSLSRVRDRAGQLGRQLDDKHRSLMPSPGEVPARIFATAARRRPTAAASSPQALTGRKSYHPGDAVDEPLEDGEQALVAEGGAWCRRAPSHRELMFVELAPGGEQACRF